MSIESKEPLSVFLQKKALFRPVKLPADYRFQFDHPFEELFFDTPDGAKLNALFFPASRLPSPAPSQSVVLYFHGNRDNLQRWGAFHEDFTSRGCDFLAVDYRGYGKSTGKPGEHAYFADARLVYDWLCTQYTPEHIILYGRSLGTAMAAYLAAHVPARMVVLETPFDHFSGLLASHFGRPTLPFKTAIVFPNDRHLRQSGLPILIFHGTRDRVVPYASAERLKNCLKPGDEFVTIQGGSHNNLRDFAGYGERLEAWLMER